MSDQTQNTSTPRSTKYTPGPWMRNPGSTNIQCNTRNVGCVSAVDHLALIFADGYIGQEQAEANATLIAAAPELLEACQEFVRKCDVGDARSKRSYEQMAAAIRKATSVPDGSQSSPATGVSNQ